MQIVRPPFTSVLVLCFTLFHPAGSHLGAQTEPPDYDEADPWAGVRSPPGPDSSAVAGFMRSLAVTDPLVCRLVSHSIGNSWSQRGTGYDPGTLETEEAHAKTQRTFGSPVTERGALAHLVASLGDRHPCVRRVAARMLGQSTAPEAGRLVREALRHQDPRLREAAALALAFSEDSGSFDDLTRALRDREPAVVRMAAYALGEMEDARAVKHLDDLLRSGDPRTRIAAASALGEIEDSRAIDPLTPLVRDRDPDVRVAAIEALGAIADRRGTAALTQALEDDLVPVRRAAAEALGEIGNPRSADALATSLGDSDVVVSRLAAQALGELDDLERAPARLVAALSDDDLELGVIAAMSLGEIGDSSAVPALSQAYPGAEPRLRYAIVRALSETDDRRGDAVLAVATRDKVGAIRRTAAEALKERREDEDEH